MYSFIYSSFESRDTRKTTQPFEPASFETRRARCAEPRKRRRVVKSFVFAFELLCDELRQRRPRRT